MTEKLCYLAGKVAILMLGELLYTFWILEKESAKSAKKLMKGNRRSAFRPNITVLGAVTLYLTPFYSILDVFQQQSLSNDHAEILNSFLFLLFVFFCTFWTSCSKNPLTETHHIPVSSGLHMLPLLYSSVKKHTDRTYVGGNFSRLISYWNMLFFFALSFFTQTLAFSCPTFPVWITM